MSISFCLPPVSPLKLVVPHGDKEVAFDEDVPLKEADGSSDGSSSSEVVRQFSQTFLRRLPRPLCSGKKQPTEPSPEVRQQVAEILQHVRVPHPGNDPDERLSAKHYYPVWCVLLYATLGAGYGTSIDFKTGAEHPNAGLHYLPVMIAGLGQAGDSKITWDGVRGALAGREHELEACRVYLSAVSGLEALAHLHTKRPADLTLIQEARTQLQSLADRHAATFRACLEPDHLVPRCVIAGLRDVGLGTLSLLKTVPSAVVSGMSTCGPLTGAAKDLATSLPHISSPIGMVNGVFHLVQAVLEGIDARSARTKLLQAEHADKRLFATHGQDCPELGELMEHRHQSRLLRRLDANLLDAHSWIRGIYGGTSLGGSVTITTLTVLGGAAAFGAAGMGVPGLVGIFLAGVYMLWYGVRANVRVEAYKRHDKACRTVAAQHGRDANQMLGLSTRAPGRPLEAIARSLVERLLTPATQDSTRRTLIALGLPHTAIDAAIAGNSAPLIPLIMQVGSQATPASETDSLRRLHAKRGLSAWEQLQAMERWQALGHAPKDIAQQPLQAEPGWTRHLASGADMGDLRKSSLTLEHIRRHWNDEGFRSSLRSLCVDGHEAMDTPQDAWRLLTTQRQEMKLQARALARVTDWVNAGRLNHISRCLQDSSRDPMTLACRQLLQDRYGVHAQHAANPLEALRAHAVGTPLNTDTLHAFLSACKASDAAGKRALVPQAQALVNATAQGMPDDEGAALRTALGITTENGISEGNLQAVLQALQKFLVVSEKLRAQTLSKVVASLHAYPTDSGFPQPLCRLAALRELRLRCTTAGQSLDTADVQHAMALARKLSDDKLHTRTFGAGEGGGVGGFGGYRLNDKGAFLRFQFEKCLGLSPSPPATSSKALRQLWEKSDDPVYRAALAHGTRQLTGQAPDAPAPRDAAQLAETVALYRTPGALEKALRSSAKHQREAAEACLKLQLATAKARVDAAFAPLANPAAAFDATGCTAPLQAFFDLEALAQRHKVSTPPLNLLTAAHRIHVYRAALAWPNKTARAKNIRAIQAELYQLKSGHSTGNPFWSARFLNSQEGASAAELRKMQELHPNIPAGSYKGLVKALRALNGMSLSELMRAVHKDGAKARRWIEVQFTTRGLTVPNHVDRTLDDLKKAASSGAPDFLVALSTLKESASRQKAEKLAPQLWRDIDHRITAEEDKGDSPGLTRSNSAILIPRNRLSLSIEND